MRFPRKLLFSTVYISILALYSCSPQGYFYHGYTPHSVSDYTRRGVRHNPHSVKRTNRSVFDSLASPTSSVGSYSTIPQRTPPGYNRVSRADAENAKFAGASNLEPDIETPRTTSYLKRKYLRRRLQQYAALNRCYPYGRDAGAGKTMTSSPQAQGRFLWDLNVYNVYPSAAVYGCGGAGGAGVGYDYVGSNISPQYDPVISPVSTQLSNLLRLFVPGILQNALAVTARPTPLVQHDANGSSDVPNEVHNLQGDPTDDPSVDPAVDPNYRPPPRLPQRTPNRIYFDSVGAPALTGPQLVGGVASTVNGIIQQLTGNVQPVYQSQYRRSKSYG